MASFDRSSAAFRIVGDSLVPEAITKALRLHPTAAHAQGDPAPGTRGVRSATGVWLLRSPLARGSELEEHLRYLLDRLDSKVEELQGLRAEGYRLDFYCGLHVDSDNAGLELSPESLSRVAALGATLGFDFYSDQSE